MSEFDKVFEENYGFYIDDSCKHRYENSKEFGKEMYEAGQQSQQAKIDELQKQLHEITDRFILRGQEIDQLNRKIYDKDQIIEACLYSDDEDILKGNKDEN